MASLLGEEVLLEARGLVLAVRGATVRVTYLSGALVPVPGGDLVDLEHPASFGVRIDALEVVIEDQVVRSALSRGDLGSFRELTVGTEGDSMLIRGRGGKLGLPFVFQAEPRVTASGGLALELERVQLVGLGVRWFVGAFQKTIERAANQGGHLIDVDAHQLVIDPFPFAGPPTIRAEFTSFAVRDRELVARLGELPPHEVGSGEPGLVLRGGVLRTGSILSFGTVLRLRMKGGGALVVDTDHFDRQIQDGFMKQGADGSVTVYVAPAPSANE